MESVPVYDVASMKWSVYTTFSTSIFILTGM